MCVLALFRNWPHTSQHGHKIAANLINITNWVMEKVSVPAGAVSCGCISWPLHGTRMPPPQRESAGDQFDELLRRGERKIATCLSWTAFANLPLTFLERIFQCNVRPSVCFLLPHQKLVCIPWLKTACRCAPQREGARS